MIVRDNDGGPVSGDARLEYFGCANPGCVQRSLVDGGYCQDSIACVQHHHTQFFLGQILHVGHEDVAGIGGGADLCPLNKRCGEGTSSHTTAANIWKERFHPIPLVLVISAQLIFIMSAMSLLASRFAAASASPVTRDKSSRVHNDFTPMLSARQVTFSRAMTSRITLLGFSVWVPS